MKKTSGKRAEKGILFRNQEIKGGRKSQERLAFLFQGFFSPGKSGGGGKQEKKIRKIRKFGAKHSSTITALDPVRVASKLEGYMGTFWPIYAVAKELGCTHP